MAVEELRLPDVGEGLREAVLVRWLVAEGSAVELNEPIAEIETAKATVEIPSPFAGTIARRHWTEGSTVPVGATLVTFEVPGGGGTRVPAATPAVRKLARDRGLDLSSIGGTGPDGRITRQDVEASAAGSAASDEFEDVPLGGRATLVDRLAAVAAIPQVTTFRTVDCSAIEELRAELSVSPLPIVVAALARTCGRHPRINAAWRGDRIRLSRRVHVGIAVDLDDALAVPVVRDADRLGVADIAGAIDRLAASARAGSLTPDDVSGCTIAVSNTGSYGSEAGTPLLSPGTAVTIALGAIRPRALVVDGGVAARHACTLSVTFDHRVLDGAAVGRALNDLVLVLEDAEKLRTIPR